MSWVDYAAFPVPLVFVGVLIMAHEHFLRHPVAGVALLLVTVIAVLHFDVGMLASDPYADLLADIDAPRRTWTVSVILLLLLAYSGEAQEHWVAAGRRATKRSKE